MLNVFEQFEIIKIWPLDFILDLSLTNSGISLCLAIFVLFFLIKSLNCFILLKKWERIVCNVFVLIQKVLIENMGSKGKKYFPFILSLFSFISILNLFGTIPYNFTPTAHIIITFGFSLSIFIWITYLGLIKFKLNFFSMFLPFGCPMILGPFIIIIEFISYCVRGITLGLRLAANITAGHLLLGIFAGFTWNIFINSFILSILPFFLLFSITLLEFAMGLVQAYVFTLLTVIYLNESFHPH